MVCEIALKLGYRVVLEFGSKLDPLPNASGGVDFKEFPFPGDNPNFFSEILWCVKQPKKWVTGWYWSLVQKSIHIIMPAVVVQNWNKKQNTK